MSKPIKLFFSRRRNGEINFGDDISPLLVSALTGRPVEHARVSGCDMAAIGSLLDMIVERRNKRLLRARFSPIQLWGTGSLFSSPKVTKWLLEPVALRGAMTADRLACTNIPFGDPGLLFDRLVPSRPSKRYKWGVVAHYVDAESALLDQLLQNTKSVVNIPVNADPLETLKAISECEMIVSSSLHGLIAADCYRIPNFRIKLGSALEKTDAKYWDYASSIARKDIAETSLLPSGNLDEVSAFNDFDASHFSNIDRTAALLEKALRDSV